MANKRLKGAEKRVGWIDSIAEKSGYEKRIVEAFLKKYNIKQSPSKGTPKRVNFSRVTFSGTKRGEYDNQFKFEFDNLSPGMWGIFSEKNGKGKTTILEVIKWLFRGKPSTHLQSGVKSWIEHAELSFAIDEKKYSIVVYQTDGIPNGEIRALRSDNSALSVISEFTNEEEMADAISEFWLNELGLNQISSFRQSVEETEVGREVIHGWPALAASLFIGTDYGAIFGDTVLSGLPTRILNMFLGLPWISTHAALKSLDGKLKSKTVVESVFADRDKENRKQRLEEIQKELQQKRQQLASIVPLPFTRSGYNEILRQYNDTYAKEKTAYVGLVDEEERFGQVHKEWVKDKKVLNSFLEDKAANAVFKRLNPTCCPHCESKITTERIEKEKKEHTCSICDRKMIELEESDSILVELEEAVRASEQLYNHSRKSVRLQELRHSNLLQSLSDIKTRMSEYEKKLQSVEESETIIEKLKANVLRLEILEEEYKIEETPIPPLAQLTDEVHGPTSESVDENQILQAALKVTHAKFKDLQEELLKQVNDKILDFCKKVGLSQYQNVTLTSNPHLKIEKDGGTTSYSNVSKGEQLRLKVISTIALISVAEERGLGRHPGFLIIDSPGAQEVNPADLNSLMQGLKGLCEILPSLQIITASVASETLLSHVDSEHRLYADGDTFLW